jgi:hypothetical protein
MAPQHIKVVDQEKIVSGTPVRTDDGSIPLSMTTVTHYTCFAMGALLLACGFQACYTGEYECSASHLPDISHVMGKPPLNKLYAMMLTFYACVKQANVRAYHQKLTGIASPCTNKSLLYFACMSCIFGPLIGFFDVFYWMIVHCTVTALFTAGEVLYMYTMVGILSTNKDKFPGQDSNINTLVMGRWISAGLGIVTLGAKAMGYDIGIGSAIIEWTEFCMSFYLFALMASIMKYTDVLVPETSTKQR